MNRTRLSAAVMLTFFCLYGCGGPDEETLSYIRKLEERIAELSAIEKAAKKEITAQRVVAKEFRLADDSGQIIGFFRVADYGPEISMSYKGHKLSLAVTETQPEDLPASGLQFRDLGSLEEALKGPYVSAQLNFSAGDRSRAFEGGGPYSDVSIGTSGIYMSEQGDEVGIRTAQINPAALQLVAQGRAIGLSASHEGTSLALSYIAAPRAAIEMDEQCNPSITLWDDNGKPRAALGCTSLEIIRTGETTVRAESSLVLFDKEGKVLYQLPP